MAYDEHLADRMRGIIAALGGADEVKMMGGLCFMRDGRMSCGVIGERAMIRLGKDAAAEALKKPGVEQMEIGGGRIANAFVTLLPELVDDEAALSHWIARGVAFADALPPKVQRRR